MPEKIDFEINAEQPCKRCVLIDPYGYKIILLMKGRRMDLITECIREKIKPEPFDHYEELKPKRSKWRSWFLSIINIIVSALT